MIVQPVAATWGGGPLMVGVQVDPVGPDAVSGSSEAEAEAVREPVHAQVAVPVAVSSLHNLALEWPVPRWVMPSAPEEDTPDRRSGRQALGADDGPTEGGEDRDEGMDGQHAQAASAPDRTEGHDGVEGRGSPGDRFSYRMITRWLHDGRQWAALRELAMHRRVLVLQPLSRADAAGPRSCIPLRAHLLWVDVHGVGQVRVLAARWWSAPGTPPTGRGRSWLNWRCHREQTDQGVRLQPSRTQPSDAPLIRLSNDCQERYGPVPWRDALDLPDARRLLPLLGTQWSLQMVLMPASPSSGKAAP